MKIMILGGIIFLLIGCQTTGMLTTPPSAPVLPKAVQSSVFPLPERQVADRKPSAARVPPELTRQTPTIYPLPEVTVIPNRVPPLSRSWATVAEPAMPVGVLPRVPESAMVPVHEPPNRSPSKEATSPQPQKPAAKPLTPAPPLLTGSASGPPSAAALASLLPAPDSTNGADFQWQDINAIAGNTLTLHFAKTNWIYLDSPEQQKKVGFQSISRDAGATTFQFRPEQEGEYTLEFQRQDLTNSSSSVRKVRLRVTAQGTRTTSTGTSAEPQTTKETPDSVLERARQLEADGKMPEAAKLLQSAGSDRDPRINLELAKLLDQSGDKELALATVGKNLSLPMGPDTNASLLLGTQLAAGQTPAYQLPAYVKLWLTGKQSPPIDLYLAVMDGLRSTGLDDLLQSWTTRYDQWYPDQSSRDGYLFRLAQWLERPGPFRNLQQAWQSYQQIVQSYPLSRYWQPAGERSAYLNRHFLQVR